jgi:hypothetical protein
MLLVILVPVLGACFLFAGILISAAVYSIVIPDPCEYHTEPWPSSILFNLFYGTSSASNGHPEPTPFHYTFVIVSSLAAAVVTSLVIVRLIKRKAVSLHKN